MMARNLADDRPARARAAHVNAVRDIGRAFDVNTAEGCRLRELVLRASIRLATREIRSQAAQGFRVTMLLIFSYATAMCAFAVNTGWANTAILGTATVVVLWELRPVLPYRTSSPKSGFLRLGGPGMFVVVMLPSLSALTMLTLLAGPHGDYSSIPSGYSHGIRALLALTVPISGTAVSTAGIRMAAPSEWAGSIPPYYHSALDPVFVELANVAALTSRRSTTPWASEHTALLIRRHLRRAADRAESAFTIRAKQSGYFGWREAREAGLKLAAIIRSKTSMVITSADPTAQAALHEWVLDGLRRWADGGLDEVIRQAPSPSRAVGLGHFIRWIAPTATLTGAAFALPLVPEISAQAGAAATVRLSMLTAAAVSLTARGTFASDQILELLSRLTGRGGND